jgi:FkbM family methyltransferase
MRQQRMAFPERGIGGWWWTWRWRLEILMGWNEYDSVEWCRKLIKSGMTVVDVGAHLGYYTRLFSRLVGPSGTVLAFESHPENFAVLTKNLSGRKHRNVKLFEVALADQEGSLPLYVSPGSSNHSLLEGFTKAEEVIKVKSKSLDTVLSELGIARVDFVKIDVEGAEPLVLAGMRQTISRSPHINLLIEYNPAALACGGEEPKEMIAVLQKAGFQVGVVRPDGVLDNFANGLQSDYVNLLCRMP